MKQKHCLKTLGLLALLTSATVPLPAFADISAILGVSGSMGTMASETGSIISRSMNVIDLHGFIGWKLGPIVIGPAAQYRIVNQLTEPAQAGNITLAGSGYFFGAGTAIYLGPFVVQGSYDFFGTHTLGTKATGNLDFSYTNPDGFTVLLGYLFSPKVSLDLSYSAHTFGTVQIGTAAVDLAGDKLKDSNYGLGLSLHL